MQAVREVDLPLPVLWQPHYGLKWKELRHDPNHPETSDAQVIDAVVEVLGRETLGWSFRRREHESEMRALLREPVKQIALFVEDPSWRDSIGKNIHSQWEMPYLSCPSSDVWDEMEELDRGSASWSDVHHDSRALAVVADEKRFNHCTFARKAALPSSVIR